MQTQVVYDALTMSTAPQEVLKAGAAVLALTALWAAWCKYGGNSLHAGVKILGVIGVILLALSLLYRLELTVQTQRFPVRTVEGAVMGRWEKTERVRNHPDSTVKYRTIEWEGFQLGGVPFVYARGDGGNWFDNYGPGAIEIRDGLPLRVSYFQEGEGGQLRITRVERLATAP